MILLPVNGEAANDVFSRQESTNGVRKQQSSTENENSSGPVQNRERVVEIYNREQQRQELPQRHDKIDG